MVNENNKLIPKVPEQYIVCELKNQQQIKKSPLSAAARSKVVNRSGSNYISSWAETEIGEPIGYGPVYRTCPRCSSNRDVSETTHKCPNCGNCFSKVAEEHERNKEAERISGGKAIYNYSIDSSGNARESVKYNCRSTEEKRIAWDEGYQAGLNFRYGDTITRKGRIHHPGSGCVKFSGFGSVIEEIPPRGIWVANNPYPSQYSYPGKAWDEGWHAGNKKYYNYIDSKNPYN